MCSLKPPKKPTRIDGTSATEEGYDAIVTAAGSLVVTGTFAGTWTEAGTTLSPTGERDLFVLSIAP